MHHTQIDNPTISTIKSWQLTKSLYETYRNSHAPTSYAHSNSDVQTAILNILDLLILSFPKANSDMHKYSIEF